MSNKGYNDMIDPTGTSTTSGLFSMFPMIEKTYHVNITDDIERDLRFLGQSRIDTLIAGMNMTLVKDKGNLKIYELADKEVYSMKGVVTVNASLTEVMNMLKMETTTKMREIMGDIFGMLFLDGVVLYKSNTMPNHPHETLSVNWMAMQSSKPHLPHRDYLFLRYGDILEKTTGQGNSIQANGTGLYVGASIWESIELDGCAPLPASQNVVRLRLRRCGIVVEEMETEDALKISFYMSESHPGRATVPTLTRAWMAKVMTCTAEIANTIVAKQISSQGTVGKNQFKNGICCHLCIKAFTLLRRKHHCRICGDVVCGNCSEMKNLKQGGVNKDIRICKLCSNSSTTQSRNSSSGGGRQNRSSSKPSNSADSISAYSDEPFSTNSLTASMHEKLALHSSMSEHSESATVKPMGRPPHDSNRQHSSMYKNDGLSSGPASNTSGASNDMIYLNPIPANNDMIMLNSKDSDFQNKNEKNTTHKGRRGREESLDTMELAAAVTENTPFAYALSYSSRQDWPKAPVPFNEATRLKKVQQLELIDHNKQFQELCEYAAAEMGCMVAVICFIGDKTGFMMAKVGTDEREVPRNVIFEAHTIMSDEPTIILDASEDVRFVNNPLVVAGKVRFYAGFPLVTSEGFVVGSFSVGDPFARVSLSGDKIAFLRNLADVVIRRVETNTYQAQQGLPRPQRDMNLAEAQMTMEELLKRAYSIQRKVRMQQVNPME